MLNQGKKSTIRDVFKFEDVPRHIRDAIDEKFRKRSHSFAAFWEFDDTFAPRKWEVFDQYSISAPNSPWDLKVYGEMFSPDALEDIWENLKLEFHFNNTYADSVDEPIDVVHLNKMKKNARKVQTFTSEVMLGNENGNRFGRTDEAIELNTNFGTNLIARVISKLDEDDDVDEDVLGRWAKWELYWLPEKWRKQIPHFELRDIMGDF